MSIGAVAGGFFFGGKTRCLAASQSRRRDFECEPLHFADQRAVEIPNYGYSYVPYTAGTAVPVYEYVYLLVALMTDACE